MSLLVVVRALYAASKFAVRPVKNMAEAKAPFPVQTQAEAKATNALTRNRAKSGSLAAGGGGGGLVHSSCLKWVAIAVPKASKASAASLLGPVASAVSFVAFGRRGGP